MESALLDAKAPLAELSERGGGRSWDVTWYLTIWLVLLFGISAYQRIGLLGAIGQPSLLVASGAAFAWVASRLLPQVKADHGTQPLRIALWIYTWYLLATFVGARVRRLTPLEQTGSVREVVMTLAMVGLALAVMDGMVNYQRLETLLRRLVWAVSGLALLGITQFITGADLTVDIPGLAFEKGNLVGARSIFNRPAGTAQHPIELSVILAAVLPLSIHFALEAESGSRRRKYAIAAVVAIALGVPLAVSRTGILSIAVALAVVSLGWSWRRRIHAGLITLISVSVLWLTVPGLVGTFRSMFTNVEYDPSIQARLDRIPRIIETIREYPIFGRGLGTFSPEDYFLIDNEVWVTTIEIGVFGLVLTLALFLLAMLMATSSRHHLGATEESSHLGYALAAGIAALATSFATFDAMFFVQLRGVLFLYIGSVGALWRLTRDPRAARETTPRAGTANELRGGPAQRQRQVAASD